MKYFLLSFYLISSTILLSAQHLETSINENTKLIGFKDKTGKLIVPENYENTLGFYGGLAPVKKDGKWGVINMKNEVFMAFRYKDSEVKKSIVSDSKMAGWALAYTDRPRKYIMDYNKEVYEKYKEQPIHLESTIGNTDLESVTLLFGYWVKQDDKDSGISIIKDYKGNFGAMITTLEGKDEDKKLKPRFILPLEFLTISFSEAGGEKFFSTEKVVYTYKNKNTGETKEFLNASIPTDKNWTYVSRKDYREKYDFEGKLIK